MSRFAKVPEAAIRDDRLTGRQFKVLCAVLLFADKNGRCNPKRKHLSEITGVCEANISRDTTALEAFGWLKKDGVGGSGEAINYTVTVPEMDTVLPITVPETSTVPEIGTVPETDTVTPETVPETDTITVPETSTPLKATDQLTDHKEQQTSVLTDVSTTREDASHETDSEENKRPDPTTAGGEGPHEGERAKPARKAKKLTGVMEWEGPSERCYELIAQAGIPREFADSQIGEFRQYWDEVRAKRPGWNSTFLNRCKMEWEREQRKPPQTGQALARVIGINQPRQFATKQDMAQARTRQALADWIAEEEAKERAIN